MTAIVFEISRNCHVKKKTSKTSHKMKKDGIEDEKDRWVEFVKDLK